MGNLDLRISGDDVTNAYTLAHLAQAAYAPEPQNTPEFMRTTLTRCATFEDQTTLTQGFVALNDNHVVLAFRGTDEPADWLTNLNSRMRREQKGFVHEGFAVALDSVWVDVMSLLNYARRLNQAVWVTGHSLGGALATLAASRLPIHLRPTRVATFGQPRVADSRFSTNYDRDGVGARHLRFVNHLDVVPTVPPRIVPGTFPPAFYTHVGQLRYFDEYGKLIYRPGETLGAASLLHDLLAPLANFEQDAAALITSGIQDHGMANYLSCLARNLPQPVAIPA